MKACRMMLTLAALAGLAACDGGGGPLTGPYRLDTGDTIEETNLCFELESGDCVERIGPSVFAAGFDSNYVVAARHPHVPGTAGLDKGRTEYFYLVRAQDGARKDPSDSVRGPYDAAAFEAERRRLGLPAFSREIASLK